MRRPVKRSETLIAVILLVLAGVVFVNTWRLPNTAAADLVGPKLYPGTLAVLLAVLSGLLLMGVASSHAGDSRITAAGMLRRFFPLVVFTAVYVILLPLLGFLVATTGLLLASFYLLGKRRPWLNLLIAAGCTLAIYLLFAQTLGVPLKLLPW